MIYEYKCSNCDFIFERIEKLDTNIVECPMCGEKAKKIISLTNFRLGVKGKTTWANGGYTSKKE